MQAPNTNWVKVIENLDHEGFYIPNQEAFSFFMSVYKRVCQVCLIIVNSFVYVHC